MTKTKYFYHGDFEFKAYCKPVGYGWEVGVLCKGRPVFVGNFVHRPEATKWWNQMNKEIRSFTKHYQSTPATPARWFCNFLGHHIYNCYYAWLGKVFTTHTRHYKSAFSKDVKKYKRYSRSSAHAA